MWGMEKVVSGMVKMVPGILFIILKLQLMYLISASPSWCADQSRRLCASCYFRVASCSHPMFLFLLICTTFQCPLASFTASGISGITRLSPTLADIPTPVEIPSLISPKQPQLFTNCRRVHAYFLVLLYYRCN